VGDALFMPATYRVADVHVMEGDPKAAEVREIVSFEGLYRDVVDDGEEIEARGKLESVRSKKADQNPADEYYRLVIGTTTLEGEGYIKPGRRGEGLD
jgi:predicted nucleotidyltransferase